MNKHNFIFYSAVILVLIYAIVLRFYHLDLFPPLMLQDEANIGFNAISIVQTGKDEWGVRMPLVFKSFGDDKPPIYFYATALVYKIIGWTPILPRIPSAIAGSVMVLVTIFIVLTVTKSRLIAIFIGLVAATSPWLVHLSRMALESNLALCLFSAGILGYEKSRIDHKHRKVLIIVSAIFFALSAWTYIAYRFVILGLLAVAFIYLLFQKFNKQKLSTELLIIILLTLALVLPSILIKGNFTRFNQTSFISQDLLTALISEKQNTCHLLGYRLSIPATDVFCRLSFNKYTISIGLFADNLTHYLSPDFLFFSGDKSLYRNPTAGGAFPVYLILPFLGGIFLAFKKHKYLLVVSLVSILPSAITGQPHAIRLSIVAPFVLILLSLGMGYWFSRHKLLTASIFGLLIFSNLYAIPNYAIYAYGHSQEYLSYSRDIANIAYQAYQNDMEVYIDRNILPDKQSYIAFWNNMDPRDYQALDKKAEDGLNGFQRPSQLGENIHFDMANIGDLLNRPTMPKDAVFITIDKLDYQPSQVIRNLTGEYVFGYVYYLSALREEEAQRVTGSYDDTQ